MGKHPSNRLIRDKRDEGTDATGKPLRRRNHLFTVKRGSKRGARGDASEERNAHWPERTEAPGRRDRHVGDGRAPSDGRDQRERTSKVRTITQWTGWRYSPFQEAIQGATAGYCQEGSCSEVGITMPKSQGPPESAADTDTAEASGGAGRKDAARHPLHCTRL